MPGVQLACARRCWQPAVAWAGLRSSLSGLTSSPSLSRLISSRLTCRLIVRRSSQVEFNNKFYHGDGYQFTPFSFDTIDKEPL